MMLSSVFCSEFCCFYEAKERKVGKMADELCISVTDDHSRITLKAENNHGNSDYINASPIVSVVCVL